MQAVVRESRKARPSDACSDCREPAESPTSYAVRCPPRPRLGASEQFSKGVRMRDSQNIITCVRIELLPARARMVQWSTVGQGPIRWASTLSSTFLGRLTCLSTSSTRHTAAWCGNGPLRHVQCGGHLGGGPALIYLDQDAGPGNRLCGTPPSPDHLPEPSLFLCCQPDSVLLLHHDHLTSHNLSSIPKVASCLGSRTN